jgi:hypothetical protein
VRHKTCVTSGDLTRRLSPRLAEAWRLSESEYHRLFTGNRADVVMETHHGDAGHFFDHGLHEGPRGFDEVNSDLLE